MSARDPNGAWDRQWRVPRPAAFLDGLYRMHQLEALHMLRSQCPLTEWEAEVLQRILYAPGDISDLQRHWLRRIERDALGEMAA